MAMMTRRELLALAAAAAAHGKNAKKIPIGVQLYTVRNLMKKDPDETLGAIAQIGYPVVEGGRELADLKPLLDKHRLTTPSVMIDTALVTGQWKLWGGKEVSWDQTFEYLKKLNAKYAVVPYLMPAERKDMPKFIGQMNEAGDRFAKEGFVFCYHNHAFEFAGEPGKRPIDLMLSGFNKNVYFENDVFWLSLAGEDVVGFITKHAGRIKMLHLKDKPAGTPVQYTEAVKPAAFKEVGNGSLDFKAILAAAEKAKVEHYMVEQDFTPGNPLDSLKQSWENLKKLGAV